MWWKYYILKILPSAAITASWWILNIERVFSFKKALVYRIYTEILYKEAFMNKKMFSVQQLPGACVKT